jgi:hypothetical protein
LNTPIFDCNIKSKRLHKAFQDKDIKMINGHQLTDLERFSLTAHLNYQLGKLDQIDYLLIGKCASRIIGFVTIPFTALADSCAHLTLGSGKLCTGLIVSPYNFLVESSRPDYKIAKDFEISSAFIHLVRVIESLVFTVLLPFICLLNPARAEGLTHHYLKLDPIARHTWSHKRTPRRLLI